MGERRLTAKAVAYMELSGAKKSGDCEKVAVAGGISKELGCCNVFQPRNTSVQQFRCGTCKFARDRSRVGYI